MYYHTVSRHFITSVPQVFLTWQDIIVTIQSVKKGTLEVKLQPPPMWKKTKQNKNKNNWLEADLFTGCCKTRDSHCASLYPGVGMGICTLEINVWGWTCDGLATHPGEKSTLLVASCLSSRDKPQQYGQLNKVILNLSSNIHCGVNRDQAFLTWCSDICAPKGAYQHRSGLLQTCCSRVSHPQQGHEA